MRKKGMHFSFIHLFTVSKRKMDEIVRHGMDELNAEYRKRVAGYVHRDQLTGPAKTKRGQEKPCNKFCNSKQMRSPAMCYPRSVGVTGEVEAAIGAESRTFLRRARKTHTHTHQNFPFSFFIDI